jgi:hypothetical protein
MHIDPDRMAEPVTLGDLLDVEEALEGILYVQDEMIARLRHQYQQETWMSSNLDGTRRLLDLALEQMAWLRANGKSAFPPG